MEPDIEELEASIELSRQNNQSLAQENEVLIKEKEAAEVHFTENEAQSDQTDVVILNVSYIFIVSLYSNLFRIAELHITKDKSKKPTPFFLKKRLY